jgi:hypothetical protein
MAAPDGDLLNDQVEPIEMLAARVDDQWVMSARFVLEDGDLQRLAAGEPFWLTFWGGVVPFAVHFMPGDEDPHR